MEQVRPGRVAGHDHRALAPAFHDRVVGRHREAAGLLGVVVAARAALLQRRLHHVEEQVGRGQVLGLGPRARVGRQAGEHAHGARRILDQIGVAVGQVATQVPGEEHQAEDDHHRRDPQLVIALVELGAGGEGGLDGAVDRGEQARGAGPLGPGRRGQEAGAQHGDDAGDDAQADAGQAVRLHGRHVLEAVLAGVHVAERHRRDGGQGGGDPGRRERHLEGLERLEPGEDLERDREGQDAERKVKNEDVEPSQEPDELHEPVRLSLGPGRFSASAILAAFARRPRPAARACSIVLGRPLWRPAAASWPRPGRLGSPCRPCPSGGNRGPGSGRSAACGRCPRGRASWR